MHINKINSKFVFKKKIFLMRTGTQACRPTLMRDELEKSILRFYVKRANPTHFLRAKSEEGLCGADQAALTPYLKVLMRKEAYWQGNEIVIIVNSFKKREKGSVIEIRGRVNRDFPILFLIHFSFGSMLGSLCW